jgi:hypothetical protein
MLLVAKPAYTVSASGAHAIRATLCAVATINTFRGCLQDLPGKIKRRTI